MAKPHLIGAYGMLWDRHAVNWEPGVSPTRWQLLGYRGQHNPKLRACNFRNAKGFYVLFDDFRAVYAGLARGRGGIGARLKVHHKGPKDWTRFCWFSLDDVIDARWSDTWSDVEHRDTLGKASSEMVIRESESLLITVLGLSSQNSMRFQAGREWTQLTDADFVHRGVGLRVDPQGFTDRSYRDLVG